MSMQWSKSYHGVQHLGELSHERRASVTEYLLVSIATFWLRGTGFSAPQATFKTAEAARSAGEAWVERGILPKGAK